MEPTTAMSEADRIVGALLANLEPQHREAATPCDEWTVHELVEHMCGGAHMIAAGMEGATPDAPSGEAPDFLADGPVAGWKAAAAHLRAAATPAALEATHTMPFGEVDGTTAVAIITADHLTHAWDLARATGQPLDMSDQLAEFALDAWRPVVPAEDRTGDGFKAAVAVDATASPIDRLVAYTGRQP